MMLTLYTIYDRITEDCCPPFAVRNDGTAARMYSNLLHDIISKEPATVINDYELYSLGQLDTSSMKLKAFESTIKINITDTKLSLENFQKGLIIQNKQEDNYGQPSQNLE